METLILEKPKITIGVPVLNEEKYIEKCINSILNQTYPKDLMEIIFADGGSQDRTKEIILEYKNKYPNIINVLDNKKRTTPNALNLCIENMKSEYFVRLDAHSDYPNDYIEKCIHTIQTVDADNVGGLAMNIGIGHIGEAFAQVISSKFGVGNSGFRTGASSGYVDTVPFGTFRKSALEKFGVFDYRLNRNQDNEINYRIRKNGGKVYLNSDIKLNYYCRNTIKGIFRQAYLSGLWNIITKKLCPGSMGIRHFIPLVFLLSLITLIPGAFYFKYLKILLYLELIAYFSLDLIFSLENTEPKYKNHFIKKIILFPFYHLSYGLGSLIGLYKVYIKKEYE